MDQYTIYLNKHHLNDTGTISRQYLLFLLSQNKSLLIQTNLESHQQGPTRILFQSVSVQCFPSKPEQPKSISQTQGIRVVELNSRCVPLKTIQNAVFIFRQKGSRKDFSICIIPKETEELSGKPTHGTDERDRYVGGGRWQGATAEKHWKGTSSG